jgi:hypothetical protein
MLKSSTPPKLRPLARKVRIGLRITVGLFLYLFLILALAVEVRLLRRFRPGPGVRHG